MYNDHEATENELHVLKAEELYVFPANSTYQRLSFHFFGSPQVRDQEIPVKRNFVKAVVHVEDCNDHSPAFLSPRYEASISNHAPTGSEVIRVKALDKDMGSNAEISYSLHTGEQQSSHFFNLLFMFALL